MTAHASKFVVIGAGLVGAATGWQLAARGHEVTILEQATPGHPGGSSHGSARIFRYAYAQALYARLVVDAKPLWDELERLADAVLIRPTGALDFGERRNTQHLARVLDELDIDHEWLPLNQARPRWPQFRFTTPVLWHPGAGVIDVDRAVETMVDHAVRQGAVLRTGWTVTGVERTPSGYRLTSAGGDVVTAEHLVVCAGGWLPALLGDLSLPTGFLEQMPVLTVTQEQAYHFPYRQLPREIGLQPTEPAWPTFIHKGPHLETYGLPGGRDADFRGQKVAEFAGGRWLTSARTQDRIIDPENRRRMVAYVTDSLPGLQAQPYAETTCLFTSTPDQRFLLDRADGITVVSSCSGHGAKFAPLIGAMAAELAAPSTRPTDRGCHHRP